MFELKHWAYLNDFSAEELAALMIGVDPRELGQTTSWQTIEPLLRRVQSDYRLGCESVKMIFVMFGKEDIENQLKNNPSGLISIELQNVIDNYSWMEDKKFVIDWVDTGAADFEVQRFSRDAICSWITRYNLNSEFSFANDKNGIQKNTIPVESDIKKNTKWPWGDHSTKDLEHLAAAAQKFWKLYDPTDPGTAPTNDQVQAWLQSERGVPKERAYYMASILRADGLPDGRRR